MHKMVFVAISQMITFVIFMSNMLKSMISKYNFNIQVVGRHSRPVLFGIRFADASGTMAFSRRGCSCDAYYCPMYFQQVEFKRLQRVNKNLHNFISQSRIWTNSAKVLTEYTSNASILSSSMEAKLGELHKTETTSHQAAEKNARDFDLIVIGAGSGGLAAARRAASYGARVALADGGPLGGACVNVGCIPKKVLWFAAGIHETVRNAPKYGFCLFNDSQTKDDNFNSALHNESEKYPSFNWAELRNRRCALVERIRGAFYSAICRQNIQFYPYYASFLSPKMDCANDLRHHVTLLMPSRSPVIISGKNVLIATGSKPKKLDIPGADINAIDSDQFFDLDKMPKKVGIIGAGYVAVELADALNMLGATVHLFIRRNMFLRNFDSMLNTSLFKEMIRRGVQIHTNCIPKEIQSNSNGVNSKKVLIMEDGKLYSNFDQILVATGREPNVQNLKLDQLPVKILDDKNFIIVDEFQNTPMKYIYAIGDVCGKVELTPVAIAAGRLLADRLFGNKPNAKLVYSFVPTVVFTHPPIASIGYTEEEAIQKFGIENLQIYNSSSTNLYYGAMAIDQTERQQTLVKLICLKPTERVIGLHIIGMFADEIIQGFAVAIKMGATKADFDRCVAIHPTAAEEVVTIHPWGMSPNN